MTITFLGPDPFGTKWPPTASLTVEKAKITVPLLISALFYDLTPDKTVTISSQSDLHPKTLVALKRLIEVVVEGGGQLSVVLVGHPKLKNDLRRPKIEEIGDRTEADATCYRQYLLHCDPLERFSLVSFVWGPAQFTAVHDHRVWGLIGVLRGAEIEQRFTRRADGSLLAGATNRLEPGEVASVSPSGADIHRVRNAFDDRNSISIHVYGGNIGAQLRSTYDIETGTGQAFISGYSNDAVPNL